MAANFEDVLSSICTQVSKVSETEFQQIFSLSDNKEAKLAYEILQTSGFELKFYDEPNAAKVYIARPTFDIETVRAKLATAQALAANFKSIKNSLDELKKNSATGFGDYTVTIVNGAANTKQIAISLIPAKSQAATTPPEKPKVMAPQAAATTPAKKPAATTSKPGKPSPDNDMLGGGPQIAREYTYHSKATRQQESNTARNLISRYFVQHIGSNGTMILAMIVVGLGLISLIVASKTFLCPDFAVDPKKQNHSTFCAKEHPDEKKPDANIIPPP